MMKIRLANSIVLLVSIFLLGCAIELSPGSRETRGSLALRVKLDGQDVFSDISTLSVKVQTSDGSVQGQDFAAAELSNGLASSQFNSLSDGEAAIITQVLASSSIQIGYATASAAIRANHTTPAMLTLRLGSAGSGVGQPGASHSLEPSGEPFIN